MTSEERVLDQKTTTVNFCCDDQNRIANETQGNYYHMYESRMDEPIQYNGIKIEVNNTETFEAHGNTEYDR